jgi:hypothetical protein
MLTVAPIFQQNLTRLVRGRESDAEKVAIQEKRGRSASQFENILLKAVDLALFSTLGKSATTAVKFYVDTSLICQDPFLFEESLNKLFGSSEKGQKILEERIKKFLVEVLENEYSVHIPVEDWSRKGIANTFTEFIEACRKEYSHRVSS